MVMMNEFTLIDTYFKAGAVSRPDVIDGIGDDAACVLIPPGKALFVSTDTLIVDVHFLPNWDPFDIAWKALMVNISDLAAMAVQPCWLTLSLTLPSLDEHWLRRFSEGLHQASQKYGIALIGGDTTRGALSMTLSIQGVEFPGKAVRRKGAKPGDSIWVSGELGAAAQAVQFLNDAAAPMDQRILLDKLLHPTPRLDLAAILQAYASAAIDISDGLSADLNHICEASGVGALLTWSAIPVHPLVKKYQGQEAVSFALKGGDDYELCFTIPSQAHDAFVQALAEQHSHCYCIGIIDEGEGLRTVMNEQIVSLSPDGYKHFTS